MEEPFLELTKEVLTQYSKVENAFNSNNSFCVCYDGNVMVLFAGTYQEGAEVKNFIETLMKKTSVHSTKPTLLIVKD
jgi:hypothetical protein